MTSAEIYKLFFKVVDIYQVKDRIVVVGDIKDIDAADHRHGEHVELHRPNGSIITAQSFEVLCSPPAADRPVQLSFVTLGADDVPVGTEVWLNAKRPERKPSRHYEAVQKSDLEKSDSKKNQATR
ncbi:hypothetical protein BH10CYA1_BH10CYA1_63220 [soil metagenome]